MKTMTPSAPEVQPQTGLKTPTTAAAQPLSFHHRPDAGRRGPDPLEYEHRHPALHDYARLLALRYDQARTSQAYYRQLRLIADHFRSDPATLQEAQVRDYFLHVKTVIARSRRRWSTST